MIEKIVYNAIVYRKSYGTSYLTAVIYIYIYIYIQHVVFHFFGGMVSAALWFFDSLIFCSGALIGYISSFHSFSSFLLVGRRWCWCSDKSLFHFFGDEISSEIAL